MHFGLFLIWLFSRLPGPLLRRAGEVFGLLFYLSSAHRRRIVRINLRLCFPELPTAQREKLLRAHFKAAGRSLIERGVLWWSSAEAIRKMVRIEGIQHLEGLKGRSIILLAPHFVGLDMGALRLSMELPIAAVYGPQRNRRMDALMTRGRSRFGMELISRKLGPRPILTSLREGKPLYYLPDQDYGRRNAVFADFFGVPASTLTGLPRLAKMANATVLPCISYQTTKGYVLRFYAPWDAYPTEDVEADTRTMNAFIEDRVREAPAQYYWLHRRFKTRPPGEKSLYR